MFFITLLEASAVLQVLREKCEFKGIPVPDPASLQSFREEMEGDWEAMLGNQLPMVLPIESFWSAIPGFFEWLNGDSVPSSPTEIPIDLDEKVVSASPTSQKLGMAAAADLERVRFAAASRLCVDLRYQGVMLRVEPYSLRRTRDGDIVLYACEADTSAYRTFRTSGITELEITRQPFVPKYANELLLAGRQN